MGNIKNLEGLKTLATIQAYEQEKKNREKIGEKLTLEEFLNKKDNPADIKNAADAISEINEGSTDTLAQPPRNKKPTNVDPSNTEGGQEENPKDPENPESSESSESQVEHQSLETEARIFSNTSRIKIAEHNQSKSEPNHSGINGCVPIGIWISNWSNLLPWLAQGYYNGLDGDLEAIRERVMLQDYMTLSKMYYLANSCGILGFARSFSPTTYQLGDEFSHAAEEMQRNLGKPDSIEKTFNNLSNAAKAIYELWNSIGFLRNCELGMGVDINGAGLTIQHNGFSIGHFNKPLYREKPSGFDGKNYSAFAQHIKVLPRLSPSKKIFAFEKNGFLHEDIFLFGPDFGGNPKPISFEVDKENMILQAEVSKFPLNERSKIRLHPIRFSAAKGVNWKGMSFSTNLGSDNSFLKKLNALCDDSSKLKAWSFSDEHWDADWNGNKKYHRHDIKKQYVGLIDEI